MSIVLWACACSHRHARATMGKHAAYVSIESLETHIVYFAQPQLAMYTQMYVYLDRHVYMRVSTMFLVLPTIVWSPHTQPTIQVVVVVVCSSIIASDC